MSSTTRAGAQEKNEYEEDGERVMPTLDSITGSIGARDSGRFV
jgi:hypothetical protein